MIERPTLMHTVIDCLNPFQLAEFYRQLLGLSYHKTHRPASDNPEAEIDWLVLTDSDGGRILAFQQVGELSRVTWPEPSQPQQLHLDFTVSSVEALEQNREHATSLGATILLDRSDDPGEPLYVFADPAGHPFCILASHDPALPS